MVRLTSQLVMRSPQVVNALRERELVVRGRNLQHLEAGAAADPPPDSGGGGGGGGGPAVAVQPESTVDLLWTVAQSFDCVDFSDNALQRLDGFNFQQAERFSASAAAAEFDFTRGVAAAAAGPDAAAAAVAKRSIRLSTIIAHNNHIARIGAATVRSLSPTLRTFAAHNNAFSELSELSVFAGFERLERLFLRGCPVCSDPNYRLWTVATCRKLKLLDGERVRDKERSLALELFPDAAAAAGGGARDRRSRRERRREDQTAAAAKRQREADGGGDGDGGAAPTAAAAGAVDNAALLAELQAKMEAATTLEEIEAIEAQIVALGDF